jgi:RNA polymerase sigma-70 factor (ECF subfamily)
MDESDLIAGCLRGDSAIQRQLYDQFAPQMYALCLRYARSSEEAQDILQMGFIKVFRKLDTYHGEGKLVFWIRRIMVNTALNQLRDNLRMDSLNEDYDTPAELQTANEALPNLGLEELHAMIQQLPAGYRAVFNLHAIEGYAHHEIAELLDISIGTSKSQFARARRILQQWIADRAAIHKRTGIRHEHTN